MNKKGEVRVVKADQSFAVDLEGLPGAGYMWELTRQPEEVELVSKEVIAVSKQIGGPSTQRFTLVAHKPGTFQVEFELKRRWEKTPVKTNAISVKAE